MNPLDYILNTARKITAAGQNAFADQNPLGIVKNTILGLPQAAKDFTLGTGPASADTNLGIYRNTLVGLPKATKEVLLPNRGYTDTQLKDARPSIAQTVTAPFKVGAELSSSLGELFSGGKGIQNIASIPAVAPLADAGEWLRRLSLPKNADEARAMRLIDVAGFLPVGSLKAGSGAVEAIAKSKNALEISDLLMSEVKNLARADAEKLAQGFVHLDTVPEVSRALNKIDYTINGVKGASNLPAVAKNYAVGDTVKLGEADYQIKSIFKNGAGTRSATLVHGKSGRETTMPVSDLLEQLPAVAKSQPPLKVMTPAEKEAIAASTRKKFGLAPDTLGDMVYTPKDGTLTPPAFQNFPDLSTTILGKLEGRSTVSKQFISDLTNGSDVKQVEREMFRQVLDTFPEGKDVPVADFADKVKAELLPLEVSSHAVGGETARYESSATLPENLRGNVKDYGEKIYASPIKTSAGEKHFSGDPGAENYFGHTRVEDMADGSTRRVIEVQSDLYQKGGVEGEKNNVYNGNFSANLSPTENAEYTKLRALEDKYRYENPDKAKLAEVENKMQEIQAKGEIARQQAQSARKAELSKLEQYNDPTAHFRMVREELKKAAEDGMTKLQFPTGETAMKIEGLGSEQVFTTPENYTRYSATGRNAYLGDVTADSLHVGKEIIRATEGSDGSWIITDVLGDGKFKAVPKKQIEEITNYENLVKNASSDFTREKLAARLQQEKDVLASYTETFDISGKIDTNNPIYKFYEKDMGRYLTNKYGAKVVTDAQGVKWYEVPVKKEYANKPVTAFKVNPATSNLVSTKEAEKLIRDLFTDEEIKFITGSQSDIADLAKVTDNSIARSLEGFHKPRGFAADLIGVVENKGQVNKLTVWHEAFHAYRSNFVSDAEWLKLAHQAQADPVIRTKIALAYSKKAYPTLEKRIEEYYADGFAEWMRTGKGDSSALPFYRRWWNQIKAWVKKLGQVDDLYQKIVAKDRGTINPKSRELKVGSFKTDENINPVDRLIAEGKIRVVSRDGRDVYQYKKGTSWQSARDESSAVNIVTREPKARPPVQLPEALDQRKINLEHKKEMLAMDPAGELSKYVLGRGDFAGRLPEVTGTGNNRFARRGDDIAKSLGFADSEQAREAYDAFKVKKAEIKTEEKALNADIKQYLTTAQEQARSRVQATPRTVATETAPPTSSTARPPLSPQNSSPTSMPDTGEARSLEKVARGSLETDKLDNGAMPPSLQSIIQSKQTPVKKKVGYLDYWRTPERVLEKIGLDGPMKKLRAAKEAIDKELPTNIERITAWSKQVPAESNKRIFKYLDGQPIDLQPNEKQVAQEIKTWLKGWAKRLGLPEDKQITHYITHLFDDQLVQKEFDEDLAKIIADKVPGSVYDPFLQQRLGAKGYKEDTWKALDAYVKRATRKVHMDPALADLEEASKSLEVSQWDYIKSYADRLNLRPTKFDTAIDNSIKQSKIGYRLGQRPVANISRTLRQTTFRGMIGANVGSALRNLSQGVNTYAKLGEKYTAIGYTKLFTHGLSELKEVGVLTDNFVTDRSLSATKKWIEKLDKGLFVLFDTAEKINRGSAYWGAKAKGIAKGMTEGEAIEYAKRIVRDTQFQYGALDTPATEFLSSDTGKIFSQFMTYPVKQTEFLAEMAKHKEYAGIIRYVLGGLAFTYTIGQVMGMDPTELIPWYDYVSGQRKFGRPPSLNLPIELTKAIIGTKDQYGQDRNTADKVKDVTKTIWGYIPGGSQLKKTIEGAGMINQGGAFDSAGRKQFEQGTNPAAQVQSLLFGKYASKNAQDYFNGDTLNKKAQAKVQPVYDQVQALKKAGKIDEAKALVNGLSDAQYEVYKSIKQAKQTEATASEKKRLAPIYQQVQALAKQGKTAEAKAIVDKLTDDEYRVYKLLKADDKKRQQLTEVLNQK